MGWVKVRLCLVAVFFCGLAAAQPWMDQKAKVSTGFLFDNIGPRGADPGAVVASPSKSNPDYFYHWIRDAALVMSSVLDIYRAERDAGLRGKYESILKDYIALSRRNQTTPNPSDHESSGRLGEPKFNADGSAFTAGWGRPQNDGPALRALTLTRLARVWIAEGRRSDVTRLLYDGRQPTDSPLKADLEFVSHEWHKTSFDIWEEISGHHFYTRLVSRRALLEGAALADLLGDGGAAIWYRAQASALETEIHRHWRASESKILPTLDRDRGIDYKHSDIDTAVLLAVLHADGSDDFYSPLDSRVLSTMEKQVAAFDALYSVNRKGFGAVAMGRYPEDRYDGLTTDGLGNPWFLTTAGVAELHYRAARRLDAALEFRRDALNGAFLDAVGAPRAVTVFRGTAKDNLVGKIRDRGDAFLSRASFHGFPDGRLSEQIHRDSGYMQGASNLTWSYASYLTAYWQR